MSGLAGRRALVCGASQGIGRACAVQFARLGAEVVIVARDEAALRQTLGDLPAEAGRRHSHLSADFSDPPALREKVAHLLETTGDFHILLNNTGGPSPGPIIEAQPEAFAAGFARHVLCNQLLVQALLPGMKTAGYGRVINIISTSVKQPIPGLGVSNTIRAAVANWAKTLAGELGPFGITVNNILPGYTWTTRLQSLIRIKAEKAGLGEEEVIQQLKADIPAGRFGRPEEIAAAAGFLASEDAAYINGINLPVDGGRTSSL